MGNVPRWLVLLAVLLAILVWRDWTNRPVVQAAGARLDVPPRQKLLSDTADVRLGNFTLARRAKFELEARVLSAERYRLGVSADLAPLDLALGWGVMSDQAVVDQLEVSQGARWYILRWGIQPPANESLIMRSSGNMHIVPADKAVKSQVLELREGEFVHLSGYLVDASGPGGFRWSSSLSRDDTGDGACELFLVESVQRLQAGQP